MATATTTTTNSVSYTCGICLDELNDDISKNPTRTWTVTNCGHGFHTECLEGWFTHATNRNCVYCMQPIQQIASVETTSYYAKLILDAVGAGREINFYEAEKVRKSLVLERLVAQLGGTDVGKGIIRELGKSNIIKIPVLPVPSSGNPVPVPAPAAADEPGYFEKLRQLILKIDLEPDDWTAFCAGIGIGAVGMSLGLCYAFFSESPEPILQLPPPPPPLPPSPPRKEEIVMEMMAEMHGALNNFFDKFF